MAAAEGKKPVAIIRHKYQTRLALGGVNSHNERLSIQPGENIDPSRSHLNHHYVFDINGRSTRIKPVPSETANRYYNMIDERIEQLGITGLQDHQAVMMEITLETSPEWYDGKTEAEIQALAKAQLEFARAKYGKNLMTADWHRDETTPHWHLTVLPLHIEQRKVRQSKRQKAAGEPVKYTEIRTLSVGKVFTPEKLESAWTEFADALKPFGLVRGEFRRQQREHVSHKTLKEYRSMIGKELPALRAEVEALEFMIEQQKSVLQEVEQNIDLVAERFMVQLKTYYQAAEVSPRLADWQRVQQSYDAMPKTAQNALQGVLQQGVEFDQKQIAPYKPKSR